MRLRFHIFGLLAALISQGPLTATAVTKPTKSEKNSIKPLESAMATLRDSKGVEIPVERHLELSLLGKKKDQSGSLYLSKGRMRLDLGDPDAFQLFMDKKQVWLVQKKPKELGGGNEVSRVKSKGMKKSNAILGFFLNQKIDWNQFKIESKAAGTDELEYTLVPKTSAQLGEIKKIRMTVQTKENRLKQLTYWDELDNESKHEFGEPKTKTKFDADFFTYKPKSSESITEY